MLSVVSGDVTELERCVEWKIDFPQLIIANPSYTLHFIDFLLELKIFSTRNFRLFPPVIFIKCTPECSTHHPRNEFLIRGRVFNFAGEL